jgi:recombinational DNA repair protein (RecF pathway)
MAFAQENEPGDLYFRLLDSTVEALAAGVDRDLATRWFETWMLRLAGIFPVPRECPLCGRDLLPQGALLPASAEGLVCRDCGGEGRLPGSLEVGPEVLEALLRFAASALPALAAEPPPPAVLRRVEELTGRVRRAFLQQELKSYDVMRRTLAGG